jgi:hypothetical protein
MICTSLIACIVVAASDVAAPQHQESAVFQRVFGVSRLIPQERVDEVKALPPGEKLALDTTGDGRINELWYLDTDKRHTVAPLLVRVVDGDGDMHEMMRGDLDSDCYFFDHHANGYFDVVLCYQDDDGDGDVDQMGIFYDKRWPDEKDDITVWWAVDVGDDNLLWYDVNGNYYQPLCQWRTHFSGDELFYQFRLTADDDKWINVWEDPFAFYDMDGDLASEVVVRISAIGHDVQNLRYSFDADDDAHGRNTHDYDFSITALPLEEGLSAEHAATKVLTIRGIETHPVLSWEDTQDFAQNAPWGKAMLTWDEINSNTDENVERDPNERWEGVLNHASKHGDFPQIGGPPSSAFNKRVEVSTKPASPLRLYFDSADERFHLLGADYGYMDVDYNLDGVVDAAYTWKDSNGDGMLDRRAVDVHADGVIDFEHALGVHTEEISLEFHALAQRYPAVIERALRESQVFVDVALHVLGETPEDVQEVLDFFNHDLPAYHPERAIGRRIQTTPAGMRFYMDLVRDRLFVRLRQRDGMADMEAAYLASEFGQAAAALAAHAGLASLPKAADKPLRVGEREYTHRMPVSVALPAPAFKRYPELPVHVTMAAVRDHGIDDFNPNNCVVVDAQYRLGWRIVPHQVDDWGFDGETTISFLADLAAPEGAPAAQRHYYIYYAPEGEYVPDYPRRTGAVLDNPAYVAWESDAGAFRFYTGQFDFFGLHEDRMLPRHERLLYPLIDVNYHEEQEWGIDALHVGKTSGLGGLTLFVGGTPHLVQSPAGEGDVEFEHRVLGAGPVRAAVEIIATNVLPDEPERAVTLRSFIYAGHPESEIHVQLPDGLEDARIAPGLMHLAEESIFANPALGLIGAWGRQGDDIGEIGLAVIALPEQVDEIVAFPDERRMICTPRAREPFKYWILGGWRRGMQYPIAPTVENWQRTVEELALRKHAEVTVTVHKTEQIRVEPSKP